MFWPLLLFIIQRTRIPILSTLGFYFYLFYFLFYEILPLSSTTSIFGFLVYLLFVFFQGLAGVDVARKRTHRYPFTTVTDILFVLLDVVVALLIFTWLVVNFAKERGRRFLWFNIIKFGLRLKTRKQRWLICFLLYLFNLSYCRMSFPFHKNRFDLFFV